jgi:hypothetical protein
LQFEHPRHRHVLDENLLRLGVDLLARRIGEGDRAVGEQLVDLGIRIAFDIVERRALGDLAGDVVAADAERGIAVLIEIGKGDVVVPLADLLDSSRGRRSRSSRR